MQSYKEGPTIEELLRILDELRKKPLLQAIAIYDCEATRENAVMLNYKTPFTSLVLTFGNESGPVFRWFFECASKLMDDLDLPFVDDAGLVATNRTIWKVKPINQYGTALVISSRVWNAVNKDLGGSGEFFRLTGPRVYDLNKEES